MDKTSYTEIFSICTGLPITEHPQKIWLCDSCEIKLLEFYKFRLQCVESYNTFLSTNNELKTEFKEEPSEDDAEDIYMEEIGENIPIIKLIDNSITKNETKTVKKKPKKVPKIYQCSYCPKIFTLSQHSSKVLHERRFHTKERPFKCSYGCEDKSFFAKVELNNHIKKYHRPYSCNICYEHFLNKEDLALHVQTHTNPKINQCDICGIQFFIEKSYILHVESHKKELELEFRCKVCEAAFSKKRDLNKHTREKHNKEICDFCGIGFETLTLLRTHRLAHAVAVKKLFSCTICPHKQFCESHQLRRHIIENHPGIELPV